MEFSEAYFKDKEFKEMSPAAIMYMQLIKPEMMHEIYQQAIKAGFALEPFDPEKVPVGELVNAMRKAVYANDVALRGQLLKHEDELIDEVLDRFIKSGNDTFIDHAVFVLSLTQCDIVDKLIEAMPNFKYPYTQSVACIVLGAKGDDRCIAILDELYHSYKKDYPSESFEQAALYGLRLLLDRRQEHDHGHEHDHEHEHHSICTDENCDHDH
ncbi:MULTISPECIES: hypothetical protein [unclassified Fusibacter]|uniref:hypothetical protein n=1 Tax=unclassified Fusibacter TaxID=2624464 RepID=UPI0010128985|nr:MULTISPECIES: hypothetical protein [unclassified Fusibacter]MCK8058502.1 hypothetical protein [Fusibacter sp. A2]NPE22729.1 hypothetical protein [Fusibacter sp. A1]RXV60289.1 hypothetical protein DWB64_12845 [Fusibacter sp. A1]